MMIKPCVVLTKSSAALFLRHINQLFDNEFGIRGKATKLKLDLNRDFAPTLKKQMVRPCVCDHDMTCVGHFICLFQEK